MDHLCAVLHPNVMSFLVPLAGLEPALLTELDFESSASTNFTTGASGGAPSAAALSVQA